MGLSLIAIGKKILGKYPSLISAASVVFNRTIGFNKIKVRGKKNKISGLSRSFLRKSRITIIGTGNSVSIENMSFLDNCSLSIRGNDNKIIIGESVYALNGDFYIEDNNNTITIGDSTALCGHTHIAVTEGKRATIGKDCLFSSDVVIRTGDSHSIIDIDGSRINHAEDVIIGNHVWLGNKTTILKGSIIQPNSIVGTGAVVTKPFYQANVILVGNPAKVVRENTNWLRERI